MSGDAPGATAQDDRALAARVEELVARFHEISETQMAGLPIYNDRLVVEAVGFQPLDDESLVGVLITPWFMNAVVLPRRKQALDEAALGRAAPVDLPSGRTKFRAGGDETVGAFKSLSLHSPMNRFPVQDAARGEAVRALAALLAPPADEARQSEATAAAGPVIDCRRFLGGRGSPPT